LGLLGDFELAGDGGSDEGLAIFLEATDLVDNFANQFFEFGYL
jgi:hypothetical protein